MTYRLLYRRRRLALALAAALASLGVTAGSAPAATSTFSNTSGITIPEFAIGVPYPSTIGVSGFAGNVQKATVTLHRFSHGCPQDIAVLLVGPSGATSVLINRVGGCGDTGAIDLTFDQAAASALSNPGLATSGTYRPSASGSPSLSPPAPGPPYPVNLDTFNGAPANGTWHLFIENQETGDMGSVGAWSLTLNAPVNTLVAGKPKLNKKKGTAQIPVTVADAGQLSLSGKGVKTASASKSVAVGGPGTVNLTVKPKGKTRKKLNSASKATVKVKITFTPNGGAPNVQTKKIKLKKTLKK